MGESNVIPFHRPEPTWAEPLNAFLGPRAPATRERYRRVVERALSHMSWPPTPADVGIWASQQDGYAPRTRRVAVVALRAFGAYAERAGFVACNPFGELRARKVGPADPDPLAEDELAAVLRAPDRRTRWGRRDAAILHLAALEGLRREELCRLGLGDVCERYGKPAVTVRRGKGDKERTVRLESGTSEALMAWLEVYPGPRDSGAPLFVTQARAGRKPGRLTGRAVGVLVAKAGRLALLARSVTPHTLRRTAATRLLARGDDLESIRRKLGHEGYDVLRHYLGDIEAWRARNGTGVPRRADARKWSDALDRARGVPRRGSAEIEDA